MSRKLVFPPNTQDNPTKVYRVMDRRDWENYQNDMRNGHTSDVLYPSFDEYDTLPDVVKALDT